MNREFNHQVVSVGTFNDLLKCEKDKIHLKLLTYTWIETTTNCQW